MKIRKTALFAISTVTLLLMISASVMVAKPMSAQSTVYYKAATPQDQELMMNSNNIQGGISYEPYVSEVVNHSWGKVLLTSAQEWPGHPSYVMLLDKSWAQRNPDLASRVVRAHMDAELWIREALANPNSHNYTALIAMGQQIMKSRNDSAAIIASALKNIEFSSNLTATSKSYVAKYTDGWIQEGVISNQSMQNLSYRTSSQFANSYIDTSYLKNASSVAPSSTILGRVFIGFVKGNIFMLPTIVALNQTLWGGKTAFEKYGVSPISLAPKGYNTSALVTQALLVGDINVGFTAICPAIQMRINAKMDAVMAAQMTANGTALVAKNNINRIQDLGGNVIASVGPETIQDLFMKDVAHKYGLSLVSLNEGGQNNTTQT